VPSPRVLFISGREPQYIRNRVLIAALQKRFETLVVTPSAGGTLGRTLGGLARLVVARPEYDVCFAGFYGQPLAVVLSALQRQPIVLDAYVSTFDTLCYDRRWFGPRSLPGRLAYWVDRQSCAQATHLVTDTRAHAAYFAETFGISQEKMSTVYVGCDESVFYPRQTASDRQGIEVFYYGAYLPLHGTDVIVQAANLLRQRAEIRFMIGGDGPRRPAIIRMLHDLDLHNVECVGWVPLQHVPDYIARADICLGGHFSMVPKAARVISTKTYQFLAMRKATIVGDNPATRELLTHGQHAYAVPMGDPQALADAVEALADDPALRERIAAGGRQVFEERLTTQAVADQLVTLVENVVQRAEPHGLRERRAH
jgi:glycosyltransferase involved in cell wall biosynthesis